MDLFGPPDVQKLKQKRDVKGLVKALRRAEELIRLKVAEALGEVGDRNALEPLLDAIAADLLSGFADDLRQEVRLAAASAIAKLDDSGAFASRADREAINLAVARLLRRYADRWGDDRIDALFVALGPTAVEALIEGLEDRGEQVWMLAARALGEIGDPRAIDPLTTRIEHQARTADPDSPVMEAHTYWGQIDRLVDILGSFGAAAARPLRALLAHENPRVRREAVSALREPPEVAIDEKLRLLAGDSDADVRAYAALSLESFAGERRVVEALIDAARDPDPKVRGLAASILGDCEGDLAVAASTALVRLLEDRGETGLSLRGRQVRWDAASALTRLGYRGEALADFARTVLAPGETPSEWFRHDFPGELAKLGNPAFVGPLVEALDDDTSIVRVHEGSGMEYREYPIREAAAAALEKMGGPEAEAALLANRQSRVTDEPEVSTGDRVDIDAVGQWVRDGDVASLARVFSLTADWDTRETIIVAFAELHRSHAAEAGVREQLKSSLRDILALCKAEQDGGSYRENCISTAERLLRELSSP